MQYLVIADLYGDNTNSLNTESERNYLEDTLCLSPTPFGEYGEDPIWSPTRWILNLTIDDSKAPITADSCIWIDKRDIAGTSLLDTAELEIKYTLDISGLGTSMELMIPSFAWDSVYWLFNGAFEVKCQGEWECSPFTLYAAQGITKIEIFHTSHPTESDNSLENSDDPVSESQDTNDESGEVELKPDEVEFKPDEVELNPEAVDEVPSLGFFSLISVLIVVALFRSRKENKN